MLIDFRKSPSPVPELEIDGVKVERVDVYKYLGTHIDSKLTFNTHIQSVHKKCQSRIYCLQTLRKLQVNPNILQAFYRSFIESIVTFSFVCWYGSLCVKSKNVLERVVNVCGKIVGVKQESLSVLYERRVYKIGRKIACDDSHALARHYELLPSGKRFRTLKFKTVRFQNTFVPKSILLLNQRLD